MLVWTATSAIASMIFSMLRAEFSIPLIVPRLLEYRSRHTRPHRSGPVWTCVPRECSLQSPDALVGGLSIGQQQHVRRARFPVKAAEDCCVAEDCCCAALLICSTAAITCDAALDNSCIEADICSALALTCCTEEALIFPERNSSDNARAPELPTLCSRALACSSTACCDSLTAEDCSSAAVAICSAPFSASSAPRSASSAAVRISRLPAAIWTCRRAGPEEPRALARPSWPPARRAPPLPQRIADSCDLLLNGGAQSLHFPCAAVGILRESPHLVCDHRESTPVLTRASCLDRRVEREEIGLIRKTTDDLTDVSPISFTRWSSSRSVTDVACRCDPRSMALSAPAICMEVSSKATATASVRRLEHRPRLAPP